MKKTLPNEETIDLLEQAVSILTSIEDIWLKPEWHKRREVFVKQALPFITEHIRSIRPQSLDDEARNEMRNRYFRSKLFESTKKRKKALADKAKKLIKKDKLKS